MMITPARLRRALVFGGALGLAVGAVMGWPYVLTGGAVTLIAVWWLR